MDPSNVVLGVSGSIAAYRAADLARSLMRRGCVVRVCLTDAATQFVTPALFEALTGQPCLAGVFEEPERGRMAHIDWARWTTALLVVPATANTLANLAHGQATDMLTTLAVAFEGPLLVAPAMNPSMYSSESVQESLKLLLERGAIVVEPAEGDVACGENGQGKLADIERIADEAMIVLQAATALRGKRVLITSGPTQEPLDDVRFLSNRSSGKMGAALARAALMMGASVTVVSGPTSVVIPAAAKVVRVRTAEEMLEAASTFAGESDLIIGAAAVADFRPKRKTGGKLRKAEVGSTIELVQNPDIIAELAKIATQARVIGFAAEPSDDPDYARKKLAEKGLFAIAANNVSRPDAGFESPTNQLTLYCSDGTVHRSETMGKLACARWLLERVAP